MINGDKLRSIRLSRGLTQGALGALAGISGRHVWSLESGAHLHTSTLIVGRLASALNVRVEDLLKEPFYCPACHSADAVAGLSREDFQVHFVCPSCLFKWTETELDRPNELLARIDAFRAAPSTS